MIKRDGYLSTHGWCALGMGKMPIQEVFQKISSDPRLKAPDGALFLLALELPSLISRGWWCRWTKEKPAAVPYGFYALHVFEKKGNGWVTTDLTAELYPSPTTELAAIAWQRDALNAIKEGNPYDPPPT